MQRNLTALALAILAAGLLNGCRAETSKDAAGERVRVATPFGGLQLKTNESAAESGIGLPLYPGATLVKKQKGNGKENDNDNGAADINLSFGSMSLRVKVLSYETADAPSDVQRFYRKELGRFGTVIACMDDRPYGQPTRTPEGLTCDKDSKGSETSAAEGAIELKAGSEQHQHTVSIEKQGSGTKFALVLVDLPKRFVLGGDNEKDRQTQ